MASCQGKIGHSTCGQTIKKCVKCGNTGCTNDPRCTNSIRDNNNRCKKCGCTTFKPI